VARILSVAWTGKTVDVTRTSGLTFAEPSSTFVRNHKTTGTASFVPVLSVSST